ncbi:hypothetical protein K435DRAFT_112118 [Dendrothele bispora CBS 962.96]|uniref:Secreted protein n=1 Tax=Dendrothele bispora (strain CBS 962.96) TaxID=1314807 RepID=A0A4S8M1E4_DENBC|nr:hypothetical protein K435DRAFT_112118 [Dendrothele bispora CBS 962.96]
MYVCMLLQLLSVQRSALDCLDRYQDARLTFNAGTTVHKSVNLQSSEVKLTHLFSSLPSSPFSFLLFSPLFMLNGVSTIPHCVTLELF